MLTACHLRRIFAGACLGAAVLMPAFSASAQPLSIDVGPSGVGRGEYTARGWMILPAKDLYGRGPSYDQASGYRIRPGSFVPDWIEMAPVENVSVTRLSPGPHEYFISPDNKVVFVGADRRVLRILRP